MRRPTVHDIAREAGVSLATVDRVLNERPGVRTQTIQKVTDAIARIGYVRDTHAANLARQRQYDFVFVLPDSGNRFVNELIEGIHDAVDALAGERIDARVMTLPWHQPEKIVAALRALDVRSLDGIAVMMPETPQVRDALARLKQAGIAVVTVVSDLPNSRRDFFVGINSFDAGQTAASLMGRFVHDTDGNILVITNSLESRDSRERRQGFNMLVRTMAPDLNILPTIEYFDDPDRLAESLQRAMGRKNSLSGIYSMASGSIDLLPVFRKVSIPRQTVVIAHELTGGNRDGLESGEVSAVISQNAGHLARSSMRVLKAISDKEDIFGPRERIRIDIVMRENLGSMS